jgi:hypothetical protein
MSTVPSSPKSRSRSPLGLRRATPKRHVTLSEQTVPATTIPPSRPIATEVASAGPAANGTVTTPSSPKCVSTWPPREWPARESNRAIVKLPLPALPTTTIRLWPPTATALT